MAINPVFGLTVHGLNRKMGHPDKVTMRNNLFFKNLGWLICGAIIALTIQITATAEVRLPRVFGSHMVLQQKKPILFWGERAE